MKRREFIAVLGGAAATRPLKAKAQQPESPVIGFLSSISEEPYILAAFRRGLAEQGFLEGRNVKIEYRYAHGDYDRLPALATELVSIPVAVIVALPSSPAALAAKSATREIPIAFSVGGDVVELGLVASYNSPAGNVTGVSVVATSLTPKRLELLHGLLPKIGTCRAIGESDEQTDERRGEACRGSGTNPWPEAHCGPGWFRWRNQCGLRINGSAGSGRPCGDARSISYRPARSDRGVGATSQAPFDLYHPAIP